MPDPATISQQLRDRLLGALLHPDARISDELTLVAFQEPVAVFQVSGKGAILLVLDHAGVDPDELRQRIDHLLRAEQADVLFLLLVGGGDEARAVLKAADREAPDPNRIGVYHLDQSQRIKRIAGRRLGVLSAAARLLPSAPLLLPSEIQEAMERQRRARIEQMQFAQTLAARPPRVTWALLFVCVLFFILSKVWGRGQFEFGLLLMGANSGQLVAEGQVWRLLSSAFLHGNEMHLIFNMIALHSFGGFLESLVGSRRYLVLYGGAALGGSLASALFSQASLSVGASGAIWGLMAAGFGLLLRRGQTLIPPSVAGRLRRRLVVVLALNAALSFLPRIDLFAHFGGGLIGLMLAFTPFLAKGSSGQQEPRFVRVAAMVTVGAIVLSVALALATGQPWRGVDFQPLS